MGGRANNECKGATTLFSASCLSEGVSRCHSMVNSRACTSAMTRVLASHHLGGVRMHRLYMHSYPP